jgi:hypothetical protein
MKNSDYMNYVALNQNILGKALIIGEGFKSEMQGIPTLSPEGIPIYLNGIHKLPQHSEIKDYLKIGKMTHPDAMIGMPGSSGELTYQFCVTQKEFLIVVMLKLDEFSIGKSKPANDLLALVKIEDLPDAISVSEDNYYLIAQEMMHCHFQELYKYYDSLEELQDWEFEDDVLFDYVKAYFEK